MLPAVLQRFVTVVVVLGCGGLAVWLGAGPGGRGAGCVTCVPAAGGAIGREVELVRERGAASGRRAVAGAADSGVTSGLPARPGLPVPAPPLPRRQEEVWGDPVAEPVFGRFREWVGRWREAAASGRADGLAVLEAEGVSLARARRRALADLIQGDAGRALALGVPPRVRAELPGAVAAWVETWVSCRADYRVACVLAVPGGGDDPARMVRWAEWDGEPVRVFTHGAALDWPTRDGVPIRGLVVPAEAGTNPLDQTVVRTSRLMAMDETPVRVLEPREMPDGAAGEVGLEIGGVVTVHADAAAARAAAAEVMASPPAGGAKVATAGTGEAGPASEVAASDLPVAESARTEGYKRLLFLRVDFPDYAGEQATIPLGEAEALLRDMRAYTQLMSFGRQAIAPVGPGGSAVTPILRMDLPVASYDDEGLSRLYPEARNKAAAAGFDLSRYDYDGVFTRGRPAASYAGLAYVGGRGFHMANGYFGKHVTTHEYGHNLGLPHAHRWDTDDKSIIGPGTPVEYGNTYDPMGDAYGTIPGEKHYTGSYKNYLDWIPDADAGRVTVSGLYRLTAGDFQQGRGRRVLRLRKDTRDYWVEFRGGLNDPLLANSVFLQWGNTDGRANHLLDVLPGVSGTTLAIGRTFSDPRANNGIGVHVTPVGKGGTFPESIDVQVTLGTPSGNRQPTAVVTANTAAAPANTPVVLTVAAADPDDDRLAYAWDFGDGEFSVDNAPVQTHRFEAAGEYTVQCAVSDMRGGVARASVVVKIEAPTVHRISGRVLDLGQQPVAGIQVTGVSGSDRRVATTDSAGVYVLSGLRAGAWTLSARETVADTLNFTMPFSPATVSVGPSRTGVDFIASSGPQETVTPLVPKNAVWKWFAQGTDPPAGWNRSGFDDARWEEGAGVLGYGNEGGQATTLPFGPSSSSKWTTSFFRRAFVLEDPAQFRTLRLEVKRDDGVVVYLNGREIFRDNMPSGTVTYATRAVDATEPNDYVVRTIDVASALPPGLLVAGTNFLAASIHQATASSSDLAFDLGFSGVAPLSGAGTSVVYVTAPSAGQTVAADAPVVPLRAEVKVAGTAVAKVEFFGDGARLGEDEEPPYEWDWPMPAPGRRTAQVVATLADGGVQASAVTAFSVELPPTVLVPERAVWKFRAEPSAAPAGWERLEFDDGGWASGPAPLGFGEGNEATVIPSGTPTSRPLTSYFRHVFTVDDPKAVTSLVARLIRDDGALVRLNGREVIRTNLPESGSITYATLATGAGPHAIDTAEFTFPLDPSALVAGSNVLAVEVHQSDATSSDLSFRLALEARMAEPRPRGVALRAPSAVTAPEPVRLEIDGVPGGGLGWARVRFFADGVLLGEGAAEPMAFTWTAPPVGKHELTVVATDTAGAELSGEPVTLTVAPPAAATVLVSFGETWRYLDDGSVPASNWSARTGFNDAAWLSGRARLGYGGDGEATVVGYGQQTTSRHITTWFRTRFPVADPAAFGSLRLRLVRDDGARVFLNGEEVMRSNLPEGTLTPTTLAVGEVTGAAEREAVSAVVPAALLVAGENVLAVEVHQAGPASSDLGFDLELTGLGVSAEDFRFTSPGVSQVISAAVDLPLSVWAAPGLGVRRVEYFAGPVLLGASEEAPFFPVVWTTPLLGSYDLTARATGAGGPLTAGPLTLTVNEPPVSALLVPAGSTWKYWETGELPAADWAAVGFADAAWKSGPARLGFGADNEATALASGQIAYYFRRVFTVSSLAGVAEVVLRFQRDDGAVIYLNGVEVARDNMAAGAVTPGTLASADAADEQAWIRRVLDPSVLRPGTNVLAAEVHQRTAGSSDLGWDAELTTRGVNLLAVANSAPAVVPEPDWASLAGPGGVVDGFRLGFPESDGRLYVIEVSEDLVEWNPQAYEMARDGQVLVRLPREAGVEALFYRARWLPALPTP